MVEAGAVAPLFELAGPTGESVALTTFRGRRVALVFLSGALDEPAPGVGAGIAAEIARAEEAGFVVLGIVSGAGVRALDEALAERLTVLLDHAPEGAVAAAWGIPAVPGAGLAVVGPDGAVAWARACAVAELASFLRSVRLLFRGAGGQAPPQRPPDAPPAVSPSSAPPALAPAALLATPIPPTAVDAPEEPTTLFDPPVAATIRAAPPSASADVVAAPRAAPALSEAAPVEPAPAAPRAAPPPAEAAPVEAPEAVGPLAAATSVEAGGALRGGSAPPPQDDLPPTPGAPAEASPRDRAAAPVVYAGAALLGLWALYDAFGYWNVTVDDAFITMKYAWNFVHGNGLVFNPGERIEGYSNPTWVGMMILPVLAGLDPMAVGKVFGVTAHALSVVLATALGWRLARAPGLPAAVAAVAGGALVAVSTPANWWAANNLETNFYGFLLVAAAWRWSVERERASGFGAAPISAFLAGLAGISRPEAPLLALALAAFALKELYDIQAWRRLVTWGAVFAVAPLFWIAVRLGYYGSLLPNTYYVKGRGSTVDMVLDYLRPWFTLEAPFALAALAGFVLLAVAHRRGAWLLGGMLAAESLFLAGMGVDWMLNQRFLVPVLPLLAAAAGAGFGAWTGRRPFAGSPLAWALPVVLAGVAAFQASRSVPTNIALLDNKGEVTTVKREPADWPMASFDRTFAGSNSEVTVWLLARIPPTATIAYSEIGLVGYATDWFIVDLAGLTDTALSGSTGLDHAGKVDYLRERAPDWLILRDGPAHHVLLTRKAAWLRDDYVLELGPKGLWVARRRDAPKITDAQILENYERAVDRIPGFISLHQPRIEWATAIGTPEQRQDACDDLGRAFPKLTDMVRACEAKVKTGGPRPDTTPAPIPVEQMAKAIATPLPGSKAGTKVVDPFSEKGTYGVGKGWRAVPPELAGDKVRLEEGALRVDAGEGPATACMDEATVLSGPLRVRGQWKVEGLPSTADARLYVRALDASDAPVGPAEGLVIEVPAAPTQDWTFIDRALDAPAGAAQARLCVEVTGSAGSVWAKGLTFTK